jgi:CheY-like chemotaxis protein
MPERATILLIEDREDDILLIKKSFAAAGITNPIFSVRDGEQAVKYLSSEGPYANHDEYPLPDLVLLDLKMPGMDGFEVLQWIRQQPHLRHLRVIVLTSSEEHRDINRAYELGANSFLIKPQEFERFQEVSELLQNYWLFKDKAPQAARPRAALKAKLSHEEI